MSSRAPASSLHHHHGIFKQHRMVYKTLLDRILSGHYANGSKLPTQQAICKELGVSRPTVIHALDDLKTHGHVRTIQGSGTYVSLKTDTDTRLGLIIPGLSHAEMERESVFPALQHQIMREASRLGWQLILGDSSISDHEEAATSHPVDLARRLIKGGVRAAIFTPHEVRGRGEAFNSNVLAELAEARVPVVLLDRDVIEHPRRSLHDLVCIDNVYGGYVVGRHLLSLGVRQVVFISGRYRVSTPAFRLEGLRRALEKEDCAIPPGHVFQFSHHDASGVREMLQRLRPQAIVCDNDYTAAMVMKEVLALGLKIPADLKMASFDDAPIARFLPVALTTISQPVEALAFKAIETLRDRIERPDMPPVTVQIQGRLAVRESTCGRKPAAEEPSKSGRKNSPGMGRHVGVS